MKLANHLSLALTFGLAFGSIAATPHFEVTKKFAIGGEGGWDYLTVDGSAHRLYISRGTQVQVMDTRSGKIIGTIPKTPGVHGIALAKALGRGYISNGRENTVTVFELKTLKETDRIRVGQNPDAILFDPATKQVYTFNGRSSDATVINAESNKVVATIPLGGKPETPAADGKGTVFVNVENTSEMAQIDGKTHKVMRRWSIAPGEEPSGLGYDAKRNLLFATCGNNILAVSSGTLGKLVGTAKIGDGPDAGGYDAKLGLAFSSNGAGTISVIKVGPGNTFTPIQEVKTQPSARTMALDEKTHTIYLIAAEMLPLQPGQRYPSVKPGTATILVVSPVN